MTRKELKEELWALLKSDPRDGVSLAWQGEESCPSLKRMDLRGLVELKRSEKGCFEVKFVDKLKAAELLERLCGPEDDEGLTAFLNSMKEDGER